MIYPRFITPPPPQPSVNFTGREEDIIEILQFLNNQKAVLLFAGMGGIGKTALAQKFFAEFDKMYSHVAWFNCNSGVLNGILESGVETNLGLSYENKTVDQRLNDIIARMNNLQGKKIAFFDNVDDKNELIDWNLNLTDWHIIVTSRAKVELDNMQRKEIEHLSEDLAYKLFCKIYPEAKKLELLTKQLLNAIDYHTLTIELLAKNLKKNDDRFSLQQLCDYLEQNSVLKLPKTAKINTKYHKWERQKLSQNDIITATFNLEKFDLTPDEQKMLLNFAVLPSQFIPKQHLEVLLNITENTEDQFDETLQELTEKGWLEQDKIQEANKYIKRYKLHKLIQDIVINEKQPTFFDYYKIIKVLNKIFKQENLKTPLEYIVYATHIADTTTENNLQTGLLNAYTADVFRKTGNLSDALKYTQKAKNIFEKIDDEENLAVSYEKLGDIYQNMGKFNEALEYFEKRRKLGEELYQSNPQSERLKNGLAISYEKLGDIYQNMGKFNEALEYFEKYNNLSEELYQSNPQSESLKNGLANSYGILGDIWGKLGKLDKFLDYIKKANNLFEELYQSNPQSETLKNGLAISYEKLGDIYQNMGKFNEALEYFEKRNNLSEELYQSNPQSVKLLEGLAISYYKLAMVYKELNQHEQGKKYFNEWYSRIKFLSENFPAIAKYKNWVKLTY